ncbi:Predicted N-acyltransferase, GNAT family [Methylobacterium sp. 174MFSha1.1]|uniref:GNAT family N-acetyltransferase n=1 Tax=Methylobacterium sp. 174MFSha1.1 TaxID=1502749 RepID=UPI0008EE0297|nr:GNAT family N-acetyltransferase [Methylobacterium sp. 174MFSha1.1]SFU90934.1 Predicted N-acyltransferase, GNAT family [Methylobacterium sp. 174MFSha1.1]
MPASDTEIVRVPAASILGEAAMALRHDVFVVEQGVPADEEIDADDPVATHFVALVEGEVVGTLRVVFKPESPGQAKIGRVAVRRDRRGSGIARRMMLRAMAHCREIGVDRFVLAAQTDKLGFYETLGFVAFGPDFMDGGIPHRAMTMDCSASARPVGIAPPPTSKGSAAT